MTDPMTRTEAEPLSASEEATMRDFAALPDHERVTMTARDARRFLATLDVARSKSATRGVEELRPLSDAASPGPWQWLDGDGEVSDELQDGNGEQIAVGFREDIDLGNGPLNRDGSFAAAAANFVRAALSVSREAEQEKEPD